MAGNVDKQLADFEADLSAIVGEDLARDLVQYGRSPNVLEAQMLMSDGVEDLDDDKKSEILRLISKHGG
jgi:hypothetical protein